MVLSLLSPALASAATGIARRRVQGTLYVAAQHYATKGSAMAFGVSPKAPTMQPAAVMEEPKKPTEKKVKQKPEPSAHQQAAVLAARLGEEISPSLLAEALTDETFEAEVNNNRLLLKGRLVSDLLIKEHLCVRYPHMPRDTHTDVADALTGSGAVLTAAKAFGIDSVVRFTFSGGEEEEGKKAKNKKKKAAAEKQRAKALQEERNAAASQAFLAVVGALYEEKGLASARGFVADTLLASLKRIDLKDTIEVTKPDRMLGQLCRERGMPLPEFRIVNEAGRYTHQPTYLVAAFSDGQNLGQGVGHSVKDAVADASKGALMNMLLQPDVAAPLPLA